MIYKYAAKTDKTMKIQENSSIYRCFLGIYRVKNEFFTS